ncbi:uncharacterized protein EAE98_003315 [Botrytis deweyae]|uniref:Fungal-type protein kinase domain-containing protein n=1 Tax=Botrytis deweyae TaxID=2478750 RepID=A0ABQ7IT54_9HELO|nr:uncharacterized protein EAE98_003315 [Botrytis deweyae]KAF7933606.1 hypothetical protein EAE98_003315 [Botrytis deweyae]
MSFSTGTAEATRPRETQEERRSRIRMEKRRRPILLSPACGGVHWNEAIERHNIAEEILIIVQFQLLQGLSVLDISSRTGKIWLATLEYISTIQGCSVKYWGTETAQGQESICLLVESKNARQWSIFQQSLGVTLMRSEMSSQLNPTNRCSRISLPNPVEQVNKLEVLMFKFDSEVFKRAGDKVREILEIWKERWRQEGIEALGNWLEDDGHPYVAEWAYLIPVAVDSQDKILMILAWNWDEKSVNITEDGMRNSKAAFKAELATLGAKEIAMNEFLLSESAQRKFKIKKDKQYVNTKPQFNVDCLASLLRVSPLRIHSETSSGTSYKDKHTESIYDAAVGRRQFPGPSGGYLKMGDFHTNMRSSPGNGLPNKLDHCPDTELLWLRFEPGVNHAKKTISERILQLRKEIDIYVGYRAPLYWGRSVHDPDEWILMIDWNKSKDPYKEGPDPVDITSETKIVQDLVKDFVFLTAAVTKDSKTFKVGFPYLSNPRRKGFPIMEVTRFEVSNDPRTQAFFQRSYELFTTGNMGQEQTWVRLLRENPPDAASLPANGSLPINSAGRHVNHFFHEYPPATPSLSAEAEETHIPKKSHFSAITMWRSLEAMQEWYTDYASQCGNYEELGHKVDKLRMLCEDIELVDSKVFDMIGDCYEASKAPMPMMWSTTGSR